MPLTVMTCSRRNPIDKRIAALRSVRLSETKIHKRDICIDRREGFQQ